MQVLVKKLTRELVMLLLFFLPRERKTAVERWLRGREDFRKLQQADCVVVSFGKSGRTWVRVMMSRVYQLKHGLSERHMLSFDNLHHKHPAIPKVFFTHDNYLRDYTGHHHHKRDYAGRKVVLLVRHPADVAVSQFFQWKYRMRPVKQRINDYPEGEVDIRDFVLGDKAGLPKIIHWMNLWAEALRELDQVLVVRYEDLRKDPGGELARIMEFIGTPAEATEIRGAVEYAAYENMKKLEERNVFWWNRRLRAGNRGNPDSFKVRRAKVGGYRDYFEGEALVQVESRIREQLVPGFGYETELDNPRPAVNA